MDQQCVRTSFAGRTAMVTHIFDESRYATCSSNTAKSTQRMAQPKHIFASNLDGPNPLAPRFIFINPQQIPIAVDSCSDGVVISWLLRASLLWSTEVGLLLQHSLGREG